MCMHTKIAMNIIHLVFRVLKNGISGSDLRGSIVLCAFQSHAL